MNDYCPGLVRVKTDLTNFHDTEKRIPPAKPTIAATINHPAGIPVDISRTTSFAPEPLPSATGSRVLCAVGVGAGVVLDSSGARVAATSVAGTAGVDALGKSGLNNFWRSNAFAF
jgi:hypothetical protein